MNKPFKIKEVMLHHGDVLIKLEIKEISVYAGMMQIIVWSPYEANSPAYESPHIVCQDKKANDHESY